MSFRCTVQDLIKNNRGVDKSRLPRYQLNDPVPAIPLPVPEIPPHDLTPICEKKSRGVTVNTKLTQRCLILPPPSFFHNKS